jgi:hypothetical protein
MWRIRNQRNRKNEMFIQMMGTVLLCRGYERLKILVPLVYMVACFEIVIGVKTRTMLI